MPSLYQRSALKTQQTNETICLLSFPTPPHLKADNQSRRGRSSQEHHASSAALSYRWTRSSTSALSLNGALASQQLGVYLSTWDTCSHLKAKSRAESLARLTPPSRKAATSSPKSAASMPTSLAVWRRAPFLSGILSPLMRLSLLFLILVFLGLKLIPLCLHLLRRSVFSRNRLKVLWHLSSMTSIVSRASPIIFGLSCANCYTSLYRGACWLTRGDTGSGDD